MEKQGNPCILALITVVLSRARRASDEFPPRPLLCRLEALHDT